MDKVLLALCSSVYHPECEYLLDLFDEDLPEDTEYNPSNLYAQGELLDVYSFMQL